MAVTTAGPWLFARGGTTSELTLAALAVTPTAAAPPALCPLGGDAVAPQLLWADDRRQVWRYDFTLPAAADAFYTFAGRRLPVAGDFAGDLRLAFVSCNGQEQEDLEDERRNTMWVDLAHEHKRRPFQLLLHGGDQLYADEVWHCHPAIEAWRRRDDDDPGKAGAAFSAEMAAAALAFYVERYLRLYSQPPLAYLLARVPSLMMWDDHDIFDGWGSHRPSLQQSAVAQGVFQAARQAFCLFQLGAAAGDLPGVCPVRGGESLCWRAGFADFSVLAPDLRSERGFRNIMAEHGWRALEDMLAASPRGRVLLISSVPVIGPRLSLVEAAFRLLPHAQKYEDDLRDQWQSRAHRDEWCRLLTLLEDQALHHGQDLTLLSGEIHLATRGTFELAGKTIHQLVASGIAHPAPPQFYARGLGLLARLGENPLPGRPTRLRPLPGRRSIYVAARNYLELTRYCGRWAARWRLEHGGWTPPLAL